MRRLSALLILVTALPAAPLQAQTAGETSVGISMNFGPRLGATLSIKRFVQDEVAAQGPACMPWDAARSATG
jgi:hypothetical protein